MKSFEEFEKYIQEMRNRNPTINYQAKASYRHPTKSSEAYEKISMDRTMSLQYDNCLD